MKPSPLYRAARRAILFSFAAVASQAGGILHAGGTAESWGDNSAGQLGDGASTDAAAPVAVVNLASSVTTVAAGGAHSLAIQNGAVYSWGSNDYGQLGVGTAGAGSTSPVLVNNLTSGASAVAAGSYHSLAIQNGGVMAWGSNDTGELGTGDQDDRDSPVAVPGFSSGVTAVAAGTSFSLVIQNGALYAWGNNADGELGSGLDIPISTTAQPVQGLGSNVTDVAAGSYHGLAIGGGALYAWGYNFHGQLGNNSTSDSFAPVPVTGMSSGVTAVAGGNEHSLAVQGGHVYAFGENTYGQLGDGTTTDRLVPVQIDPAELSDIIAVTAAGDSSYALASDGSLWVWGDNSDGQLGVGSATPQYLTPQHLLPPTGSRYITVSAEGLGAHVLAIVISSQYTPPAFFTGETALGNGIEYLSFPNGNYFGYYAFLTDPDYLYHFDLGYEYVFDTNDGYAGICLYDYASDTFFYTSPTFPFPYLYDFTLKTVLYYYPDPANPGHYNTNGIRYFYDFATGTTITK